MHLLTQVTSSGPGTEAISATGMGTICNMVGTPVAFAAVAITDFNFSQGAEIGATTSCQPTNIPNITYFPTNFLYSISVQRTHVRVLGSYQAQGHW